MDTQRLILVGAAVVQLTLWIMLAGRYRAPAAAPDSVVLRYGWKLRLLGLCIAFGIPMCLIVVLSTTAALTAKPVLPLSITLLTLGFVGGGLLVETQGVHLVIAETTLVGVSPWRRRREWRWHEIERVTYSRFNQSLVLYGPRQERLQASFSLIGIGELAQTLLRRVAGPKITAPTHAVLQRLGNMR